MFKTHAFYSRFQGKCAYKHYNTIRVDSPKMLSGRLSFDGDKSFFRVQNDNVDVQTTVYDQSLLFRPSISLHALHLVG